MKKYFFLLIVATIFVACKKGDVGPQGPEGPTGPQGPQGAPNVKYSAWFTPNAYTLTTLFGIKHFTYDKNVPEITQPILDSGLVIVFGKLLGYNPTIWPTSQVSQLPIALTYVQSGSTMTDTWSALTAPQKLTIRFVNDKNEYNAIATAHQFRYIIVPGGSKISGRSAAGNFEQMSYSEICSLFQIPE